MADALGQFSFAVEALRLAHFFLIGEEVLQDGLHLGIGHAAGFVCLDGLVQLAGAQFHVVEVRNGLSEGVGDIGKHGFESSEGLAGIVGILGIDGIEGEGVTDEDGNTPVGFSVGPVGFSGEAEHA